MIRRVVCILACALVACVRGAQAAGDADVPQTDTTSFFHDLGVARAVAGKIGVANYRRVPGVRASRAVGASAGGRTVRAGGIHEFRPRLNLGAS